ncbi:MAG: NAD(P)/FAD-dependent oxidoreductase [Verrucomicrobiota bacterium]
MSASVQHTGVLIVGAGPAGLGVAAALKRAGVVDQLVIDSRDIGASFRNWPRGMSLLTPSFHSNSFGLTDLNAIDPDTSPADFLRTQHPEGHRYADYLQAVAEHHQLPVSTGIHVRALRLEGDHFIATTRNGEIFADYVVWAAGQFFHPRVHDFPGAHFALHSSKVEDWSALEGDEFTVIGGYESGVDAALNLIAQGKSVRLISRGEPWSSDDPDPSRSLSPRTLDRLRELLRTPEKAKKLEFAKNTEIRHIEENEGWWTLRDQDDIPTVSWTRPILANGFESGLGPVDPLFDHDENGLPIFSEEADESTLTPGLFYSGPSLTHRNSLFCFIYKFRARFGVIAYEIATRIGKSNVDEKLMPYLKAGFMNDDLDCCTDCQCAIEPAEAAPESSAFAS